jgi:hypothetical protein
VEVCILGDSKYKEEIYFIVKKLENKGDIIYTPTLNKIEDRIEKYNKILVDIKNSKLIILIYDKMNDEHFMFYFGIVFGLDKKYKAISINHIKSLMGKKGD